MKIEQGLNRLCVEEQIAMLGWQQVRVKSSILLALAKIVHSGDTHEVKSAPAGKGTSDTVLVHEQYIAWEVDSEGNAISGSFGSPRALSFVHDPKKGLTELKPGIWENAHPKTVYLVPDDVKEGDIELLTREGQKQYPAPGCAIGIDPQGYGNVIKAADFKKKFTVLS